MERVTFSLLFYIRRTKLNRNDEAPIMLRITVNGVRADMSVKKAIQPQLWNSDKGKAIEKKKECKELNLYLDAVHSRILKIQRDMEIEGKEISAPMIIDRYLGRGAFVDRSLFKVFREHNEKCKKLEGVSIAPATVQRYETSLQHTQNFVWDTYHKKDFFLSEMSPSFIEDFMLWLQTTRKCSHNTATKYLKNFKKIILIALAKGWLKSNPFAEYKFSLDKVERDFLEDSEIQKILVKDISIPRLAQVRDIFAFCCFTGLAYVDVANLKQDNIRKSFDGKLWIITHRQKTNTSVNVPLLDIAKMILDKYKDKLPNGKILPIISNQITT